PGDPRAPSPLLAQAVGVIGLRASAVGMDLDEGARALAIWRGDLRERLLHELAARRATGHQVALELGYSPHRAQILCENGWQAHSSAVAVSSAAAARAGCCARNASPSCRASTGRWARAARSTRPTVPCAGAA